MLADERTLGKQESMPELPEVETIARGLRACLPGRRIVRATVTQPRVLLTPGDELVRAVRGATVAAVDRHGKHLLLRMERRKPFWLVVHLGMTGQFVCEAASQEPRPHTHASFELDGGDQVLRYSDIRQFGRLEIVPVNGAAAPERLARLGPDPLEISAAAFVARLRARSARVKALLLDQRFLRGLGNIYADESLFRAGIRPSAASDLISRARAAALWHAMRSVLQEAIARGGSSVSDYVDAAGRAGSFQEMHRVYGRAGEDCLNCGRMLRRSIVAGRGTSYCGTCQK